MYFIYNFIMLIMSRQTPRGILDGFPEMNPGFPLIAGYLS